MKEAKEKPAAPICANEGCQRPAAPGERFCETCAVEWTLYRRDTRGGLRTPPPRPVG
jgi:hypothetical protein